MPLITARHIPDVTHIGHLESGRDERRPTLDGPGIAVSVCPDEWRAIKGLNGPEFRMSYSPAQWLDALSFNLDDQNELAAWMLTRGYMRPATVWHVSCYDEEADDIIDATTLDRAAAAAKAGRSLEQEIAAAARGEGAVMEGEGFVLERRAMARLGGVSNWPDPLRWFDAAVLLYAREVVLEKRPFIVGVWWGEPRNAEAGLADYGVLFPERAHLFSVENDEGEVREFAELFPDLPGLAAEQV